MLEEGRYADAESAARSTFSPPPRPRRAASRSIRRKRSTSSSSLSGAAERRGAKGRPRSRSRPSSSRRRPWVRGTRESPTLWSTRRTPWRRSANTSEATKLEERALEISTRVWGPDDRHVALVHQNLGTTLSETDPLESERHRREALRIYEAVAGPESVEVANVLNGLANLTADRGEFAEAEAIYTRVIRIHETALGPRHPNVGTDVPEPRVSPLGDGGLRAARTELEHALSIRQETVGREHPADDDDPREPRDRRRPARPAGRAALGRAARPRGPGPGTRPPDARRHPRQLRRLPLRSRPGTLAALAGRGSRSASHGRSVRTIHAPSGSSRTWATRRSARATSRPPSDSSVRRSPGSKRPRALPPPSSSKPGGPSRVAARRAGRRPRQRSSSLGPSHRRRR